VLAIVNMFKESKVRAEAVDDLKAARWDKQVWNVPFNGLGALLDATTDKLIADQDGTALVRAVMDEVMQAAIADGVRLPPETPEQKIAVTRPVGAYLTSTQIDRQQNRAMEIEAIFGKPVEFARAAGLRLPLLEMLYWSLRHINQQKSDNRGNL
jgi:2-dehydropantoate 2-reductase